MAPHIPSAPPSDSIIPSGASTPARGAASQRFTLYTAAACGVAAIGGVLFGYDIGVTGGVTADRFFLQKVRGAKGMRVSEGGHGIDAAFHFGPFVFFGCAASRR